MADYSKPKAATKPVATKSVSSVVVMKPSKISCKCQFCADYEIEKFAELISCGCYCHHDGYSGHDSLCCSLPNVLLKEHVEVIDLANTSPDTNKSVSNPPDNAPLSNLEGR